MGDSSACGLCCTRIEHFGVNRGGNQILEDVNLHIHCGELTALIGPNGAGKTTLLKAILGEVPHTGDLKYLNAGGKRSGSPIIGYVPQRLDFDSGSPISVLDLFAASHSRIPAWLSISRSLTRHAIASLERVEAAHLVHRRLGNLSGGELQRVLLALALDPIPDLLLLDEPVSGVDLKGLELFYQMVSALREQYDLSIILVSHDLNLVSRYADRVIYLNRSVRLAGTPEQVFGDPEIEEAFGRIQLDMPPRPRTLCREEQ